MARDKNMRITTPDGEQGGGGFKRFIVTLVIIVTILYVGAFFGLRTDGARSLVEGWFGKHLGEEIKIAQTKLAFPLGLTAVGITTVQKEGLDGVHAREVTVKFFSRGRTLVQAKGAEVVLVRDPDGTWNPRFFSKLGEIPEAGIESIASLTQEIRDHFSISLQDGVITWLGPAGERITADGVDFEMLPVKLPGRKMNYYKLKVFKCSSEGIRGPVGKDIVREWLSGAESPYVDLMAAGQFFEAASPQGMKVMEIRDEDQ